MAVRGPAGQGGVIQGSFGKSGKFKVHFPSGIALQPGQPSKVTLVFKRYVFDPDKRHMAQ
jgi:selenocysteine-specific elongation factor